ncbi:MAG: putative Ig domain-containing protein, partial [Bacteroidetes bacterium]|nr:putative Ig domain-containing protein [Bacteroidota bacterium]
AQALKLDLDTVSQYIPVTLGTAQLTEPWVDSDAALQGSKDGGADTFLQSHPETRVALAFTINNPVQNRFIPQGEYWLFRYQADVDTMTCMVDASSGSPFVCIAGNNPTILTNPPTTARIGVAYVYTVNAFGNPLPEYRLTTAPAGMTIDSRSGRINWTPPAGSEGGHDVTLEASNRSGTAVQSYTIAVSGAATEPHITSTPITETVAGQQYMYRLTASGSPPPSYSLEEHPTGMLIDGGRGNVLWAPTRMQAGPHAVRIRATNPAGSDEQSFTLEVFTVPVIAAIPNQTIPPEREFTFTPSTNAHPDPTFTLNAGPTGLTIDSNTGEIRWTPTVQQIGTHVVLFEAANRAGRGQQSFDIEVDATASVGAPPKSASDFRIVSVWPQPAVSELHLSLHVPYSMRLLHLAVYDALGRLQLAQDVQSSGSRSQQLTVSVETLRNGVYTVLMTTETGTVGTQFIIAR